jgi:hypothetical protein
MPRSLERARRRGFTEEYRGEAFQMMLDGHMSASVAERLGLSGQWCFEPSPEKQY